MNARLGVLVGGGPAPGINGVIAAVTIEALKAGLEVLGIENGYKWLAQGDASHVRSLTPAEVRRIQEHGGSIIGTARVNPGKDQATLERSVRALRELGVRYLVSIGGDDTTFGATKIAEHARGEISVVAVPKTIDNDLPLPDGMPTFGFETAREVGTRILDALIEDAHTTGRWYIAVTMGRTSGSLALGIAQASGAALAIIPEELEHPSIDLVADSIVGAIIKRKAGGCDDGVAIVAEGIVERFDTAALDALQHVPRDAYGHVRLAEIPFGSLLRDAVTAKSKALGLDAQVVTKDIGYELRCAGPLAFDRDYTRMLGYGAVRYLLEGGSGALVALRAGRVEALKLEELLDPSTGRIRVRHVDVNAEPYQVARRYMSRIEREDLREPALSELAAIVSLAPSAFAERFTGVVEGTHHLPERTAADQLAAVR